MYEPSKIAPRPRPLSRSSRDWAAKAMSTWPRRCHGRCSLPLIMPPFRLQTYSKPLSVLTRKVPRATLRGVEQKGLWMLVAGRGCTRFGAEGHHGVMQSPS